MRVTLSGDTAGDRGQSVPEPECIADAMARQAGLRPASDEEFTRFLAGHREVMLPPDGEG